MTVHLVGAGPGDPALLTLRGAEVLARADVVIHDEQSRELLELASENAERIAVDPSGSGVTALLVEHGRRGREVVRLESGDPFGSGCGAEEARAVLDAGLDLEVVPGVTAVAAADAGWFEQLPLFGRRVVVTRTIEQAGELSRLLRRRGAAPVEVPTIRITDAGDGGAALSRAIAAVADYDWVVLTSPNGATRFCAGLRDARQLGATRVAAIGPGTAAALADHNIVADLVPEQYVAEALLAAFPAPPADGGRVLLARAADARDVLPDGLRAAGWTVDVVPAYRTLPASVSEEQQDAVRGADVVTFTSSSTVRHFVDLVGADAVPPIVACIGPITAATARELGLAVDVEAAEHTIAGLVRALEDHEATS